MLTFFTVHSPDTFHILPAVSLTHTGAGSWVLECAWMMFGAGMVWQTWQGGHGE